MRPVCTFVIFHRVHAEHPLLVGATRDELYAREAAGPAVLRDAPRIAGGRDLARGGTWMGVAAGGLFVGLTNQRTFRAPDPGLGSRGEVVLRALEAGSVAGVDGVLAALDVRTVASFNLLYGDGATAKVAYARREAASLEVHELSPGLHVLPNDRLGSPEFPKVDRALALARPLLQARGAALEEGLARVLADHDRPPLAHVAQPPEGAPFDHAIARELQAICIHTPLYGTRSATIAAVEPGRVARYLFADGPPCTSPFRDYTPLANGA